MTPEEAQAIIKANMKDMAKIVQDAIGVLHPELAESEDEKIRKFLIKLVNDGFTHFPDSLTRNGVLTYLEKQKEQKPILSDRDSTDFEIEVHEIIAQARNDSRLNDADVLKQFEEEAAFALMLKANKLIEQKPVEWDELQSEFRNINEAFEDGKKEVVAHPEKYGLCKSAEWSEEDKKRIKQLIYDTEAIRAGYEKKKEQLGDRFNDALIKDCDEQIRWLKSLRPQPHWKPSEEQMEALKCAIEDIAKFSKRGGRQVELENEPYYSALHSLYCNLEKLM